MKYLKKFNEVKTSLSEQIIELTNNLNKIFKLLGITFRICSKDNIIWGIDIIQGSKPINSLLDLITKSQNADDSLPINNGNLIEIIRIIISEKNKSSLPEDILFSNIIYHFIKVNNEDILPLFLKEMLLAYEDFTDKYRFFPTNLTQKNSNEKFNKEMPYLKELILYYIKAVSENNLDYDIISKLFYKSINNTDSFKIYDIIKKLHPEIWNRIKNYKNNTASELGEIGF